MKGGSKYFIIIHLITMKLYSVADNVLSLIVLINDRVSDKVTWACNQLQLSGSKIVQFFNFILHK